MTVERLTAVVILCAGMGVAGASADEVGKPIAVAVPVSGKALTPNGEADIADSPDGSLDEEYMPLDLPDAAEGKTQSATADTLPATADTPSATGDTPPAAEKTPGLENAVLGLDDEPTGVTYLVHAQILGVPNSDGVVSASLCKRKNFTKSGCRTLRVPAREGQVSVTFDGVAPGTYAIQVHHDQNDNGKMDFTFLGLPKEPYGFSRDAKPMLAPPKFDSASFEVVDGDVSLIINLQNT